MRQKGSKTVEEKQIKLLREKGNLFVGTAVWTVFS